MLSAAIIAAVLAQPNAHQTNVMSYMAAERAFSSMAAEKGFRESFLHFFAPDGIGFNPEAHIVPDELSKQAPEKTPLGYHASWEPMIADCSIAGDMGFTTGPFVMTTTPGQPPLHISYFSIWKRMPNGDLRVMFDLGTQMKDAPEYPKHALGELREVDAPKGGAMEQAQTIAKTEAQAAGAADFGASLKGLYGSYHFVAYRVGAPPLLGADAAAEWHAKNKFKVTEWKSRATSMASKADFAWTWGSYKATEDGKPVAGYWAHVWCYYPGSGWKIAADVMSQTPPKE
jgi:hypothetical protein